MQTYIGASACVSTQLCCLMHQLLKTAGLNFQVQSVHLIPALMPPKLHRTVRAIFPIFEISWSASAQCKWHELA